MRLIRKFVVLLAIWEFSMVKGDLLLSGEEPAVRPEVRSGLSAATIPSVQRNTLRVAYLIPNNRTAQSDGVYKLQSTLLAYQSWFGEQMQRNGFGPKTFNMELETDGRTPKIHVVNVNATDAFLRGDLWGRTINAASAAGVPVWNSRQVWWLVPEAHVLNPDGSLSGGTALGASFGSGDDAGVGMIGSDGLVRMKPEYLFDNRNYAGLVLPELGPHAMVQDVTFPWFEGSSLSSVCSSIVGAGLHELSHGFGLPHNMRNDENMHGNLMGNGLRGWRGNLYPDRYPNDYVRLSYGNALFLNFNRYFNSDNSFNDQTKPTVTIQSPTTVSTTNGAAHIQFRVNDAGGLGAAWLIWKGELVDEMTLSGTLTTQRFETPFFSTGAATEYKVVAIDVQGNRGEAAKNIAVTGTGNTAPRPKIKITPTYPIVGQTVTFNASTSTDPDDNASLLQVEWDLDNDGAFETSPSTQKTATRTFHEPGVRLVRARLRDPEGAMALSEPVGFRIFPIESLQQRIGIIQAATGIELHWPITPFGFQLQSTTNPVLGTSWSSAGVAATIWGLTNRVNVPETGLSEFFRLAQ